MKKKLIALLLCAAMSISVFACGKSADDSPDKKETTENKKDNKDEDSSISAEENLLSVEVTLPASLVDEDDTSLTEDAKKAGVKDITKNDDGSITMKMTKNAHKKLLDEMKVSIDESIEEILADKESCPSFDKITYNDDLTVFDISVDQELYGIFDSMYALTFYFGGDIYQALNAVPEDQIKTIVNFKDKNTGEIIESGDSSALEDSESSEE